MRARLLFFQERIVIEILETRRLFSTVWYVATNGGLNSNPGTLAQPFQTIQAAANVAQAGDTVLIEGGVYHETVKPAFSGSSRRADYLRTLWRTIRHPRRGRPHHRLDAI